MKKFFILFVLGMFIISSVSADIIILKQPQKVYNLGSILNIPIKINALNDIDDFLSASIVCQGFQREIHKEYVSLETGEEKEIEVSTPIRINLLGSFKKKCKIKFNLSGKYVLSDDFLVSNVIHINITNKKTKFAPGEPLLIEGSAIKEDKTPVNGFLNLSLTNKKDNSSKIIFENSVSEGYFYTEYELPKDLKAGDYDLVLKVYEKNNLEEITNYGEFFSSILIKQVPTSLEIILSSSKIEPGTETQVKVILHDQTGEAINSTSLITIKNNKGNAMTQKEVQTGEPLNFRIKEDEPPSQWIIHAKSGELYNTLKFDIAEKQEIKIDLLNKTLLIQNTGNVPYNKTISVKIGDEVKYIDVYLNVGESKKYALSAPDGKYMVVVGSQGKDKFFKNDVALTGNAISVREQSINIGEIIKHPVVLGFIIILFFVFMVIIKKNYKRSKSFFKHKKLKELKKSIKEKKIKKQEYSQRDRPLSKIIDKGNLANLSLTIKGEKQSSTVVCLDLKNYDELKSNKNSIEETINKIVFIAEKNRAYIYEGKNSIFFILIPSITKTFQNEKNAINIAESLKKILD